MRKLLLLAVLTFTFISCEKNDVVDIPDKVLGEWQMYRNENLESVIDQWTGTEWTRKDEWFKTIRNDSEIIFDFNEDGTFIERYADVPTANGVWLKIDENSYSFNYVQEGTINANLTQKRYITFYCDNTFSVTKEGNTREIEYYKIIDATECADLIPYKVTD